SAAWWSRSAPGQRSPVGVVGAVMGKTLLGEGGLVIGWLCVKAQVALWGVSSFTGRGALCSLPGVALFGLVLGECGVGAILVVLGCC
ncbi:hypothetical protein, partial [Dermatophilus congolensis]|uniref:hypothetical protein n=1 Tax=Dermatophilus congolensis TaxID=1863 RepID=UPI001AB04A96